MADGEIILRLDPATEQLLKKAAADEGVTPEELGARVIACGMIDHMDWPYEAVDPDPEIDRNIARETRERGDGIPLDDVLSWLDSWGKPDEQRPPDRRRR